MQFSSTDKKKLRLRNNIMEFANSIFFSKLKVNADSAIATIKMCP